MFRFIRFCLVQVLCEAPVQSLLWAATLNLLNSTVRSLCCAVLYDLQLHLKNIGYRLQALEKREKIDGMCTAIQNCDMCVDKVEKLSTIVEDLTRRLTGLENKGSSTKVPCDWLPTDYKASSARSEAGRGMTPLNMSVLMLPLLKKLKIVEVSSLAPPVPNQ